MTSYKKKDMNVRGFTLLEILLVVAAIAILAGIVIVAINPARQLGDTRNAQRRSDVEAISSAIQQYYIKHGFFPIGLQNAGILAGTPNCNNESTDSFHGVCTGTGSCSSEALSGDLAPDYITAIPSDPSLANGTSLSGYTAIVFENNRFVVCAPLAESDTIFGTR